MPKIFDNLDSPELTRLLQSGSIGIIPTDTVYGLVCSAFNERAVKRLYALKHREHKPGTIIAANIDQLVDLGIKARYLKAVEQFWPNPLSIIIPTGFDLQYLHLGEQSLAIRIPKDPKILEFVGKTGSLLTTSANPPKEPVATTLEDARKYFGGSIDFYVDGGNLSDHVPSTIIRVIDDAIEILREGGVNIDENGRIY